MRISNSKKQLAKIISENGGWRDGAEWAVQHKTDGRAVFTKMEDRPEFDGCWDGFGTFYGGFVTGRALPNWHQTILSRDEYFHLYPAPDADGWIVWNGGECPVLSETKIDTKHRCGRIDVNRSAGGAWWGHRENGGDIMAYRICKPAEPAVANPERIVIEPEPTIEQLAADYKAKLAIAQQAQEEADSHRCGAEAALEKLVAAGKALGLALSVATPEPELVITDWRDLQVGDVVEVTGSYNPRWVRLKGVESVVTSVGTCEDDVTFCPHNDDTGWVMSDNTEWRFLRRPTKEANNA